MSQQFDMTDMGKLSYYLGNRGAVRKECIQIKQTGYAKKIIKKAGMKGCNPTKFPMDPKEPLVKDDGGKQ